jgi:competence protein ComFB
MIVFLQKQPPGLLYTKSELSVFLSLEKSSILWYNKSMYKEIHNVMEDYVCEQVEALCALAVKDNAALETNVQDRRDIACYVLNRVAPHYVLSNRGVTRIELQALEAQQREADIAVLVHEGILQIKHNQRPGHTGAVQDLGLAAGKPVFNIPTILGRVYSGVNFAPLPAGKVSLYQNGELVVMKDRNWQNPYELVRNTEGAFTFWPAPLQAESSCIPKIVSFNLVIEAPGYEKLSHFFQLPLQSEGTLATAFSMDRTFKMPELYVFPPGEAEQNG